jgi:hypothetical protein
LFFFISHYIRFFIVNIVFYIRYLIRYLKSKARYLARNAKTIHNFANNIIPVIYNFWSVRKFMHTHSIIHPTFNLGNTFIHIHKLVDELLYYGKFNSDFNRIKEHFVLLKLNCVHDRNLGNIFDSNRDYINNYLQAFSNSAEPELNFIRWFTRYLILLLVNTLLTDTKLRSFFNRKIEKLAMDYLNLYIDYVILEARIRDKLIPFEGIRIVKELINTEI